MPSTITVMNENDSGVGSLRQALLDASDGDTINFAESVARISSGGLVVGKSLDIEGPGAANLTINGGGGGSTFQVTGSSVTIAGLSITGGSAFSDLARGGGIDHEAGSLVISRCSITGNSANLGGGIYSTGNLAVIDSTLSGNGWFGEDQTDPDAGGASSGIGGGIYSFGSLTITNSVITGNGAFGGSGMNMADELIINMNGGGGGGGLGGGVFSAGGTVVIVGGSISNNGVGGGNGGSGSLSHLFDGIAGDGGGGGPGLGGGLCIAGGSVSLVGVKITGNAAGGGRGGDGGVALDHEENLTYGAGGGGGAACGGVFLGANVVAYRTGVTIAGNTASGGPGGLGGEGGGGIDGGPGGSFPQIFGTFAGQAAPAVLSVKVNAGSNDGSAQRSNVERLTVQFSRAVNLPALIADGSIVDAVRVLADDGSPVVLDPSHYRFDATTNKLNIDLTVDGFGNSRVTLLADGRFHLALDSSRITAAADPTSHLLDAGDGVADGTYQFAFLRLLGDFNGDGSVDASDVDLLAPHLGTKAGQAGFGYCFDLNRDRVIDATDSDILSGRLGLHV